MGSTQSTWGQGSVEQESKRYKLCVRKKRKVHGRLKASWKISCLAVNGQSFLVIDGYLLNPKKKKKKKKKVLCTETDANIVNIKFTLDGKALDQYGFGNG